MKAFGFLQMLYCVSVGNFKLYAVLAINNEHSLK